LFILTATLVACAAPPAAVPPAASIAIAEDELSLEISALM